MKAHSAGLVVYRKTDEEIQVLIVHPGGPFFAKKDDGVWSLPKGLVEEDDDALETAKREFKEETGFDTPEGEFIELGEIVYPRGDKAVTAWAVQGDFDETKLKSNEFEMDWPPRSGKKQSFPEIDRGGWFSLAEASVKLFPPNLPFLERLAAAMHTPFNLEIIPEPPKQGSLF